MENLLPVLKNRNEFDRQNKRGMFVDLLFENISSPIIMYGEDSGGFMGFKPSTNQEEDLLKKEQAIKNLEALEVPFEVQQMQGHKIAFVEHEYAAEKILDKAFMKEISNSLGSNSIVVGIPMKGFLAAVVKGQGESNLYGAIVQQYQNAQTYPISKLLYYIVDGKIEMLGGEKENRAVEDSNVLPNISGVNDERGKIGFVAKVGSHNEDELSNQIQTAFQNIILHGMKDSKNFNGKIDFHISSKFNQLTGNLEERIKKIAKNISERGAVQIMGGLSKEEFNVRFYYGDNKLIAETNQTDPIQSKDKGIGSMTKPKVKNDLSNSESIKDRSVLFEVLQNIDEDGRISIVANVGDEEENELENLIHKAYQNILSLAMKNSKKMNGAIDFHISSEINNLTPSLEKRINEYAKRLSSRGALKILSGLSGQEFRIRFYYGDSNIIAELIEKAPEELANKLKSSSSISKTQENDQSNLEINKQKPWWKFW